MPVGDIFLTATEMRNNPAFFAPIHTEARQIEDAILAAANLGLLDVTVSDTLMTDTTLASWQTISSVQVSPTNTFNLTAHGFLTGDQVQFLTTGTLPTPINSTSVYYVIKINDNSFKLAATKADSVNGTPITISAAGSGSIQVRGVTVAQQFYNVWQGLSTDRVKTAQLTSLKSHFTNLGYTISQQSNPTTNGVFVWLLSW